MDDIRPSHPAVPDVSELLAQAMAYGQQGGSAQATMADGRIYAEAFIDALDALGWTLVRSDPKEADVDAALADSQRAYDMGDQLRTDPATTG